MEHAIVTHDLAELLFALKERGEERAAAFGRVECSADVHVELGVLDQVELEHAGQHCQRAFELAQREQHKRSQLPSLRLEEASPPLAARV